MVNSGTLCGTHGYSLHYNDIKPQKDKNKIWKRCSMLSMSLTSNAIRSQVTTKHCSWSVYRSWQQLIMSSWMYTLSISGVLVHVCGSELPFVSSLHTLYIVSVLFFPVIPTSNQFCTKILGWAYYNWRTACRPIQSRPGRNMPAQFRE